MKIIFNNIIPFKGFLAINLFGVLFVRGDKRALSDVTINHEKIHTAQMKELWYIGFYMVYLLEWLVRLCQQGNAYRNISFEREAYLHERDMSYLHNRPKYAMWKR